jgi:hypothetical protein
MRCAVPHESPSLSSMIQQTTDQSKMCRSEPTILHPICISCIRKCPIQEPCVLTRTKRESFECLGPQ